MSLCHGSPWATRLRLLRDEQLCDLNPEHRGQLGNRIERQILVTTLDSRDVVRRDFEQLGEPGLGQTRGATRIGHALPDGFSEVMCEAGRHDRHGRASHSKVKYTYW